MTDPTIPVRCSAQLMAGGTAQLMQIFSLPVNERTTVLHKCELQLKFIFELVKYRSMWISSYSHNSILAPGGVVVAVEEESLVG